MNKGFYSYLLTILGLSPIERSFEAQSHLYSLYRGCLLWYQIGLSEQKQICYYLVTNLTGNR